MRSGKETSPYSRNPETSCSNVHISQTTGRNLVWILPDEGTDQVLLNGIIINIIRPAV